MAKKGWICLYRQLQDCWLWCGNEPFDKRSAWVDLLLLANHADKDIMFDGAKVTIGRGQYMTSVRKLSERWKWSKDKTLKFLRALETDGMITKDSDSRRTLVTIANYDIYQDAQDSATDAERTLNGHLPVQSTDAERTLNGRSLATNNNDNNVNNEEQCNNENNIYTDSAESDAPPEPPKKKKDTKHQYGEYNHVLLTDKQRDKLFEDYGEAEALEAIKFLDEYIQMKGYKAKDHNLVMRKWVFDAVREQKQKQSRQNGFSNQGGNGIDWSKI